MKSDYQKLLDAVLKFLSFRPRSKKEIVDYLSAKTHDPDLANRIIIKLETSHLIDDYEFAQWLVASRSRSRPRGPLVLKQELARLGVSPEIISQVLPSENLADLAELALSKKLSLWKNLSPKDFRAKAIRFLQSRGFTWSVIESVLKKQYNNPNVN